MTLNFYEKLSCIPRFYSFLYIFCTFIYPFTFDRLPFDLRINFLCRMKEGLECDAHVSGGVFFVPKPMYRRKGKGKIKKREEKKGCEGECNRPPGSGCCHLIIHSRVKYAFLSSRSTSHLFAKRER